MKLHSTHKKLIVLGVMLVATIPSFAAGKRRAVNHPSPGVAFTATVKGTVVDATNNQPVAYPTISVGAIKITGQSDGTFEVKNVTAFGTNAPVVASRSGYNSATITIPGAGTHTLNFRLQSRATVSVRMTNGTTIQLDDDSIKLGYVAAFSGYVLTTSPQFCKTDGTRLTIAVTEITRLIGPATLVTQASCCSREGAQLQRIRVVQRSGESSDMTFKESCDGYQIDLNGREHVSGDAMFLKFSEIAEVTFP